MFCIFMCYYLVRLGGNSMNFNINKVKFEKLAKEKFGTERKLFINMIRMMYPDKDSEKFYDQRKGNFSAAKNNKRPFQKDEILCLEKLLNVPFVSLLEDDDTKFNFIPDGIRYAAYLDDIERYERLNNVKSHESNPILLNYDEFDKNIFQYVLEYNSSNGLSYLINEGIVTLDANWMNFLFHKGLYYSYSKEEALKVNKEVIQMLISKNKFEEFNILFSLEELIRKVNSNGLGMLNDEEIIKSLLNNEGFITSVLKKSEKIRLRNINIGLQSDRYGYFVSPLITILINYGLMHIDIYENTIISLLNLSVELNRKVINYFKMNISEGFRNAKLDRSGLIREGRTIVGAVANYVIENPVDLSPKINNLLQKLDDELNEVAFSGKHLTGGLSDKQVRIENGKLIKKHSNNKIEYEFLKFMESVGYDKVPKIIEINKNEKDIFTYIPGNTAKYVFEMSEEEIKEVLLELKRINNLSKDKFEKDKVCVHGDLSPQNVVFKDKKLVGIIDWDSCYIGPEYYDFIYVFWIWCNVGKYGRDNEKLFCKLKKMLEIYGADSIFKHDFANKIRQVMESRLKNIDRSDNSYERIYQWVKWSEVWVDLYEDKIRCEIENDKDKN